MSEWNRALKVAAQMLRNRAKSFRDKEVSPGVYVPNETAVAYRRAAQDVESLIIEEETE